MGAYSAISRVITTEDRSKCGGYDNAYSTLLILMIFGAAVAYAAAILLARRELRLVTVRLGRVRKRETR